MKVVALVCLIFVLTACASRGHAVRCDDRLEPINTPAGLGRTIDRVTRHGSASGD